MELTIFVFNRTDSLLVRNVNETMQLISSCKRIKDVIGQLLLENFGVHPRHWSVSFVVDLSKKKNDIIWKWQKTIKLTVRVEEMSISCKHGLHRCRSLGLFRPFSFRKDSEANWPGRRMGSTPTSVGETGSGWALPFCEQYEWAVC
jgi:hypothetical protein